MELILVDTAAAFAGPAGDTGLGDADLVWEDVCGLDVGCGV